MPDLSYLHNLRILNLSYNLITSIQELKNFQGKVLKKINLVGNKISELKELNVLNLLDSLEEVYF